MDFVDVVTNEYGNIYSTGNYVTWDNGSRYWIDYYIVKCNPQGDTLWTALYDVNLLDKPRAIALDKSGNIIITGTTTSNPSMGEYDYLTLKLHNTITGVPEGNSLPNQFLVLQSYPNPFNSIAVLKFQLSSHCVVSLRIYDLLGREIDALFTEEKLAGIYTARWNAEKFASGIYIARLTASKFSAIQKLVLIK